MCVCVCVCARARAFVDGFGVRAHIAQETREGGKREEIWERICGRGGTGEGVWERGHGRGCDALMFHRKLLFTEEIMFIGGQRCNGSGVMFHRKLLFT